MTRVHRIAALTVGALTATYAAGAERNAYFGDLHIHTRFSFDAFTFGTRATPDDAYRYARGEAIKHPAGFDIQLDRPLDFYAVTDHARYLGRWSAMMDPNHPLAQSPEIQPFFDAKKLAETGVSRQTAVRGRSFFTAHPDPEATRSAWRETIASAERNYEPGKLTTFVAYEYTSSGTDGGNQHRNVIFRSAKAPEVPFSRLDSPNPEDLWDWLEGLRAQGIEALAIPHNSNQSAGHKFARQKNSGEPFDAAYARLRMRNEPLVEVTQIKGTSETHPLLSTNDEWANFEIEFLPPANRKLEYVRGSYVREAYLTGLELEENEGFNPYRFGMIGSSDGHNGGSAYQESKFFSKLGVLDATPELRGSVPAGGAQAWGDVSQTTGRAARVPKPPSQRGGQTWGASGLVACGPRRTPANRSMTRSAAKRRSPLAGRASGCVCSPATTSRAMRSKTRI